MADAKVIVNYEDMSAIADAIRSRTSSTSGISVTDMPLEISEIDNSPYGKIPSYWKSAVNTAKNTVKALKETDSDNIPLFAWFSDCHNATKYSPNSGNTGIIADAVMGGAEIPFAICCGDVAASSGNGFTEIEQMEQCFILTNNILAPIGWHRLLLTQGNHDGSWGTANNKAYAYQMSPTDLYKYIYRKFYATSNHIFGGGDNSYYYADDTENKIRIIMLNSLWCETSENADGTAVYDRQHYFGFGQEQLSWLANTALQVAEDWHIVLATHVPPTADYKQYIRDYDIIRGLLSAYADKSVYTGSYTYNSARNEGTWANVSITADFTSAVGEIVGLFCGHCHKDQIITDDLSFPIVTITSDADLSYDDNEETRVTGTDNENAIDFVTINKIKKEVVLTRLGVGTSRVYSYKGTVIYAITNRLTNVINSNGVASIEDGTSYSATLTANDGYEMGTITVTMGGTDITSTAVSGTNIIIANVTGDIVITASATKKANYTNLADPTSADWSNDDRLGSSGTPKGAGTYTGGVVTNWIAATKGDVIRIKGINIKDSTGGYAVQDKNGTLDVAKCASYSGFTQDVNGVWSFTIWQLTSGGTIYGDECTRIRFSGLLTAASADGVIITKNEEIT